MQDREPETLSPEYVPSCQRSIDLILPSIIESSKQKSIAALNHARKQEKYVYVNPSRFSFKKIHATHVTLTLIKGVSLVAY